MVKCVFCGRENGTLDSPCCLVNMEISLEMNEPELKFKNNQLIKELVFRDTGDNDKIAKVGLAFVLANLEFSSGEYENAIKHYDEALIKDNQFYLLYLYKGLALLKCFNFPSISAFENIKKAVDLARDKANIIIDVKRVLLHLLDDFLSDLKSIILTKGRLAEQIISKISSITDVLDHFQLLDIKAIQNILDKLTEITSLKDILNKKESNLLSEVALLLLFGFTEQFKADIYSMLN